MTSSVSVVKAWVVQVKKTSGSKQNPGVENSKAYPCPLTIQAGMHIPEVTSTAARAIVISACSWLALD